MTVAQTRVMRQQGHAPIGTTSIGHGNCLNFRVQYMYEHIYFHMNTCISIRLCVVVAKLMYKNLILVLIVK